MKQAVILAAGEGQRLRPFTLNRPKVMLAIAGRPIIGYVVEAVAKSGIRRIVLVVGYHKEQVFDYLGSGEQFGVEITYVTQEKQLGTAHALAQAASAVDEEFFVLPGDNLIDAGTISEFIKSKPETVLVKRVDNPQRYGVVTVEGGTVRVIREKPREEGMNLINTGIYALNKEFFRFIKTALDIPDVLNRMIEQGHVIKAMETGGTWLDVIYSWDILSLNSAILKGIQPVMGGTVEANVAVKGRVAIGKDTVIRSNSYIVGPAVIGANCEIGPNVCILPTTSIGDNVVIESFTEVKNSVLGDDVHISSGGTVEDSVIDRSCSIGGHFVACRGEAEVNVNGELLHVTLGAMLGEGCKLGSNVIAQPGVIVGAYSQVRSLKTISGRLPDRSLVV
jgi:UDP-N-acetylglucosamine diphosphorylase/glucosamine-1-phosphate N-acetyltransferase